MFHNDLSIFPMPYGALPQDDELKEFFDKLPEEKQRRILADCRDHDTFCQRVRIEMERI
ncbi:MAG: hypothetical protein Q4G07_06625 [Oscillospiraceae bacterium]|nr:hypothetical protein [Oscillospiraceae bacterium]